MPGNQWPHARNEQESVSNRLAGSLYRLHYAGYRTGLFGKYINTYDSTAVPPGWNDWFDFYANDNGTKKYFPKGNDNYVTDVLSREPRYANLEWFDHQRNMNQALAAKRLKPLPFIVFQSDEPFDLTPYVEDGSLPMTADEFRKLLYDEWQNAMADLVSKVPGARFITETHSGDYIHQQEPQLVIDSVREVVEAARKKSCALGIKNHCQCVKCLEHAQR